VNDDDMTGVKIGYIGLSGYRSTAYLDTGYGDTWAGTDKYTDDPITVRWTGTEWQEQPSTS
jgi:hypothetical protein